MEQKNNTGAIFKNDYKKTDSQPDYKGKAVKDLRKCRWYIEKLIKEIN